MTSKAAAWMHPLDCRHLMGADNTKSLCSWWEKFCRGSFSLRGSENVAHEREQCVSAFSAAECFLLPCISFHKPAFTNCCSHESDLFLPLDPGSGCRHLNALRAVAPSQFELCFLFVCLVWSTHSHWEWRYVADGAVCALPHLCCFQAGGRVWWEGRGCSVLQHGGLRPDCHRTGLHHVP